MTRSALFGVLVVCFVVTTDVGHSQTPKVSLPDSTPADARFSPGGRFVVTLDKKGVVKIVVQKSNQLWGTIGAAAPKAVTLPAFSGDDRWMATAHADQIVQMWECMEKGPLSKAKLKIEHQPTALAFGSRGTMLAIGTDHGDVQIREVPLGKLLHTIHSGKSSVLALAFAADGKTLGVETATEVRLWRLESKAGVGKAPGGLVSIQLSSFRFPSNGKSHLSMSADSQLVAVADAKGKINLVDTLTGKTSKEIDYHGSVGAMKFMASKELAVFGDDGSRTIFDPETAKKLKFAAPAKDGVSPSAISPHGNQAIVRSAKGDSSVVELMPDPRYVKSEEPNSIPVYFGTNRQRATIDQIVDGVWYRAFTSLTWWIAAGLMLLAAALALRLTITIVRWRAPSWVFGAVVMGLILLTLLFVYRGNLEVAVLFAIAIGVMIIAWLAWPDMVPADPPDVISDKRKRRWLVAGGCLFAALSVWFILAIVSGLQPTTGKADDPDVIFTSELGTEMTYGICRVTIPRTYIVGSGAANRPPKIWDIELRPEDPNRDVTVKKPDFVTWDELREILKREIQQPYNQPRQEAFVFVHGYNNTFKDAAIRAALFARDMEFHGPPILFSWPAGNKYEADEDNARASQKKFTEFFTRVVDETEAKRIYVLAHSMGNRLLTNALAEKLAQPWQRKDVVVEVILIAPDVYLKEFTVELFPSIKKKGPNLTLYASSKDVALWLSDVVVHTHDRLGQGGDALFVDDGLDSIDASTVASIFDVNHAYAFTDVRVQRDIRAVFESRRPAARLDYLTQKSRGKLPYWLLRTQ